MKKTNILLIIVLLIFNNIIYSQKSDPSYEQLISNFEKIKNQLPSLRLNDMPIEHNGRLKFRDRNHFLNFYQTLSDYWKEELILGSKSDYYLDPEDTTVLDPQGGLLAFENNYLNYVSIRSVEKLQESFDLLHGIEPKMLKNEYNDDLMSSLFNSNLQIEISDTIYWQFDDVLFFIDDERVLEQIEKGRLNYGKRENPWEVDPHIVIKKEIKHKKIFDPEDDSPCNGINANFISSGHGLNYSFTFTGSPSPNSTDATVSFYWSFGDGTTSSD